MIAYIKCSKNPDNEYYDPECPWASWYYNDGDPLPDNAVVVTDEEFSAITTQWASHVQLVKDKVRYLNRARVKDSLIAEICTENMQRIRGGIWTVDQLISLTVDADFLKIQSDINSLSFELAQSKIMSMTNPLITQDIKLGWVSKLQENLFI
jgi:hypothetical protein